jgi:pimeloyl-ACP methyl ester carboxylesterase
MRTFNVNGTKVAFADEGADQPVVLLHSSTGSKGQWRAALAGWADRYRVMAPDLLGYGDTGPWGGPRPHRLADEVEIAVAVIARTDRPVHLVGHSYGGAVALHTAMELGSRIASLSLIEPTTFYLLPQAPATEPEAEGDIAEIAEVVHDIDQSLAAGFPLAAAQRFVDYWCGEGAWLRLPSDRKWRTGSQMHKVHQDFHALLHENTELARVAAIKMPTLILCGTNSPSPTRRLSRIIAEAIPGARHRTIPSAGHMLPLTHTEIVNAFIAEHMERVDRQGIAKEPTVVPLPTRKAAAETRIPSAPPLGYGRRLAHA